MKPAEAIDCRRTAATIRVVDAELSADISVPDNARGLIVFGDGVGANRHSPLHDRVAKLFNKGGLATVLADLISENENAVNRHTGETVGGLDLLERRVIALADWIAMQPELRHLPLAFFGDGAGAEAALIASARRPEIVRAIVSCGPRLQRVEHILGKVFAPALFIFGNNPELAGCSYLDRQRSLIGKLPASTVRELGVVRTPRNLFDEPTVVDEIAAIAHAWYKQHLTA